MKGLLIVVLFTLFASMQGHNEEELANLRKAFAACVQETGVVQELVLNARRGEFSSDPALEKYYFCMFNKFGLMDNNGNIQLDVIRKKFPSDFSNDEKEKVIQACKNKKGSNKYEAARLIYECYYTVSPKHIILA